MTALFFHILLSIVTFCVLSIAGLLAVLLAIQQHRLKFKPMGGFVTALPPLESMEIFLFRVVKLGFLLLSALLITSLYFYYPMILAGHTKLIQKTLLVVAAWFIFGGLLWGRYRWGLRGRKAIYSTLCGILLLLIAYLVSEFMT